jgi:hypothetical protein
MDEVVLGWVFGTLAGIGFGLFIGATFEGWEYQAQANERNYALFCPISGEWAWKGECDK